MVRPGGTHSAEGERKKEMADSTRQYKDGTLLFGCFPPVSKGLLLLHFLLHMYMADASFVLLDLASKFDGKP